MRTKKRIELENRMDALEDAVLKQGELIGDITDLLGTMTENLKTIYNITFLHKN